VLEKDDVEEAHTEDKSLIDRIKLSVDELPPAPWKELGYVLG